MWLMPGRASSREKRCSRTLHDGKTVLAAPPAIVGGRSTHKNIDFRCAQETKWKCKGAIDRRYKFFLQGCNKGTAGVGVFIAERWINSVVDVVRVNERIMYVKWLLVKETWLKGFKQVCGMTKGIPRHKETWWWYREVEEVVAKRKLCCFVCHDQVHHQVNPQVGQGSCCRGS